MITRRIAPRRDDAEGKAEVKQAGGKKGGGKVRTEGARGALFVGYAGTAAERTPWL